MLEQDVSKRERSPPGINQASRRWIWFGFSTLGYSALPAPLQQYGRRAGTQLRPMLEFKFLKSPESSGDRVHHGVNLRVSLKRASFRLSGVRCQGVQDLNHSCCLRLGSASGGTSEGWVRHSLGPGSRRRSRRPLGSFAPLPFGRHRNGVGGSVCRLVIDGRTSSSFLSRFAIAVIMAQTSQFVKRASFRLS
jgi:hypothetical protein